MSNTSVSHPSTLLIPESVVWLPYAGIVIMVLSWLGYDFFRFHRKNKLKYVRMRETRTVEKDQPSRRRINMISSVGLRYKNGLPVLGDVWNTSPSASDYSTSSHARKTIPCLSTDITPSDDDGPSVQDEIRTARHVDISPLDDLTPETPVERRKARSPRYVGSGGGSDRSKAADKSHGSLGFSHHDSSMDSGSGKFHGSSSSSKGSHSRSRRTVDKIDEGGGGGGRGNGDGGGGSHGDENIERLYPDGNRDRRRLDANHFEDDRVIGDSATQTSFTMADLHHSPGRSGSQHKESAPVYNHPGIVNPRVLAISPPKGSSGSGRESPRGHRSRQNSNSSSPRQPHSPRTVKEGSEQPIIIDFSKHSSARDERSVESAMNPATPRHQPQRRESKNSASSSGRRSRESVDEDRIDEPVFPGSIRRLPATPSGSVASTPRNSAFSKIQPTSSSKRQTSFSRHANELDNYDNSLRTRSQRDDVQKPSEKVYLHPQTRKERDREPVSARNPSPDTRETASPRTRPSKSCRISISPRTSSDKRHHRKGSESSKHSSSESPPIPSHFYHEDEEGFFSSKSSRDTNSSMQQEPQHAPRKGIHFFSQLGSGRRDSTSGHSTRKTSAGSSGGGGGFGDDGGSWHGTGFSGGGFDS